MGVGYELLDTKNRRSFDLGKGAWAACFERIEAARPTNAADLAEAVRLAWAPETLARADFAPYIERLTTRLHAFCEDAGWELRLWNDASEDSELLAGFERVGSRYESDGAAELAEENDHRRGVGRS
jgi:hypothetical protein